MKLAYTLALTTALLTTAMSAGTMAQMGSASGDGAGSRGGAASGGTTGPAQSSSTLPLGTDRQQLDAAPAFRGQSALPNVITGAVGSSAGFSSAPLPSSSAPVVMPVRPSVSLLAARAMRGTGTSSSNPACTGTSANAEVCKGWE